MALNIPFETALQLLVMTYVALIRLLSTSNLKEFLMPGHLQELLRVSNSNTSFSSRVLESILSVKSLRDNS